MMHSQGRAAALFQKQMGYTPGSGLGKHEQGRPDIVSTKMRVGRRGLGAAETEGFETDTSAAWPFAEVLVMPGMLRC